MLKIIICTVALLFVLLHLTLPLVVILFKVATVVTAYWLLLKSHQLFKQLLKRN